MAIVVVVPWLRGYHQSKPLRRLHRFHVLPVTVKAPFQHLGGHSHRVVHRQTCVEHSQRTDSQTPAAIHWASRWEICEIIPKYSILDDATRRRGAGRGHSEENIGYLADGAGPSPFCARQIPRRCQSLHRDSPQSSRASAPRRPPGCLLQQATQQVVFLTRRHVFVLPDKRPRDLPF